MIDQALAETDEMLTRFRALQRIGEIERRDRQAFFEPVRLQSVLEHVIELHEPLAEDLGVRLGADFAPDAPAVSADPTLLFEAVSNLVDNALKFTPAGGKVTIRLVAREDGPRGPRCSGRAPEASAAPIAPSAPLAGSRPQASIVCHRAPHRRTARLEDAARSLTVTPWTAGRAASRREGPVPQPITPT